MAVFNFSHHVVSTDCQSHLYVLCSNLLGTARSFRALIRKELRERAPLTECPVGVSSRPEVNRLEAWPAFPAPECDRA